MMVSFPPRVRRMAGLILATLLACSASASAMQELGGEEAQIDGSVASPWLSLPVRAGIFIALVMVAWAFGFYVFFPWILNRKNAMTPLRAYGLTAALIWVAWCALALVVFQDMLVLKSLNIDGTAGEFLRNWSLTCAICLGAFVGFALLRAIFGGQSARIAA